MDDLLAGGFVAEDRCEFTFFASSVVLAGMIVCVDGINLDVHKEIHVLEGRGMAALVQTRTFRYHAWVRGVHNILRYESAHSHRQYPHKHTYDTFGYGRETLTELESEDSTPTLAEVLRELEQWHVANASRIRELG